jgi:hypothetical protein
MHSLIEVHREHKEKPLNIGAAISRETWLRLRRHIGRCLSPRHLAISWQVAVSLRTARDAEAAYLDIERSAIPHIGNIKEV